MKSYILEAEESHHLLQLLQACRLSGTKIPHTFREQKKQTKKNPSQMKFSAEQCHTTQFLTVTITITSF